VTETLAPANPSAAAAGIPKPRRAASKLCHDPLVLPVKQIELGSSQSTPTSSAYRRPVAVDLLLPTISGLPDMLYGFLVSS
jgi:hypothetical protein